MFVILGAAKNPCIGFAWSNAMTEHMNDAANITNREHAVLPLKYPFVFITLLIGAAITVAAAKLEIGIFKPVL